MSIKKMFFVGSMTLFTLYSLTSAAEVSCQNDYRRLLSQIEKYGSFTIPRGPYRGNTIGIIDRRVKSIGSTLCQVLGHDGTKDRYVIIKWTRGNWGNTVSLSQYRK